MVFSELFSVFTFLISNVKEIVKDYNDPDQRLDILETRIRNAWKQVQVVVESHLKGNETEEVAIKDIETLTSFCYDAEDLAEIKKREHIVKVVLNKVIKRKKISVECGKIEALLATLKSSVFNTISRQDNIAPGRYDSELIGRENDKKEIIQMLTSCDGCEKQGISIVGMCGVGKSLLARTIFYDQQIENLYPCRLWHDVKDGNFVLDDIKKVTKDLLPDKYTLIVIDNLLHVYYNVWVGFLDLMKKEYKVRLMVTTQSRTISRWDCFSCYDLGLLTDCCCAKVIETNANANCSRNLSRVYLDNVAAKCEGLPLVASWVGNFIRLNSHEGVETIVERSQRLSQVAKFKEEIFPQLMSSYIGIMTEQMRCLAYFSLFPEGHPFDIDELVHLWIGECFIMPEDQESLKSIKKKYGDWLQEKLILQSSGKLNSFVQDYAILAASQTCLQLGEGNWNEMTRHLSFSCSDFNNDSWSAVPNNKKLRTFLSLCNDDKNNAAGQLLKVPPNFCKKLSRLRVLSFKGLNIDMIPGCIDDLKHLQYLNISFTPVEKLPKEFRHLQTLKFLKLKNSKCSHLLKEFYKLSNLIYVDWDESTLRRVGMPCNIGKLSKLESLPLFKVGTEEGYLISEFKEMNKLQGTLKIMDLQRVKSYGEAKKATLKDKSDLTTIMLEWNSNSNPNGSDGDVLRGLELHKNAKVLQLMKYGGKIFPDWIKDSHLEKIHLKACGSLDSFPVLGKLKYLETLILEDMKNTTVLSCRSPDDNQAADPLFPALESLELNNMTLLERITGLQTGDMKYIRKFKAAGCTAIANMFAPKSEDESIKLNFMSIFGNIVLQHTLEIMIDDLVLPLIGKRKRDDIYKKITQGVYKIDLSDDQISHTQPTPSSLNDMANSGTLEIDSMAVDQEYSTHQEYSNSSGIISTKHTYQATTPNHSGQSVK